jgi:hypothetical protein
MCAQTMSVYQDVLLENGQLAVAEAQFANQK